MITLNIYLFTEFKKHMLRPKLFLLPTVSTRGVFKTLSNFYGGTFQILLTVFAKFLQKGLLQMFGRVLITESHRRY